MKNNWKTILWVMMTVGMGLCWACSDDDKPEPEGQSKLEISVKELGLKAEGEVATFMVTTEGKGWEMKVENPTGKIEVTPVKGEVGKTEISVSAGKNDMEDARQAVLTIRLTDGSDSAKVAVSQSGVALKLSRKTDSLALVALFNALDGANWKSIPSGGKMEGSSRTEKDINYPWELEKPMNEWHGVTLGQVGNEMRVTGLIFPLGGVAGKIPEQLIQLRELKSLEFMNAIKITGSFPEDIYRLTKCSRLLVRSGDLLNVTVSERMTGMTELKNLMFQNVSMKMEDFIRLYDLQSLDSLSIMTGAINGDMPAGVSRLKNLIYLCLNSCSRLTTLSDEVCQLEKLKELHISGCIELPGLPEQIGNLKKLEVLYLIGCKGIKTLPSSVNQLSALKMLHISAMGLTGDADQLFSGMKSLEIMFAPHNLFTGSLNWIKGKPLKTLYMQENKLKGVLNIPELFTENLEAVMLGDNEITGTLAGIGRLRNLGHFDVSDCQLDGEIPAELGQLPIYNGSVKGNNLTGNIPAALKDLMKNMGMPFFFTDNRLKGTLPREIVEAWLPHYASWVCRQQEGYGFSNCEN